MREMQITLLTLMLLLTCGPAVSPTVKAETVEETPLHQLLVIKFGKLSGAEEKLASAAANGETADCTDL